MNTRMLEQLGNLGVVPAGQVHRNFTAARLVEAAIRNREAVLSEDGALMAHTGQHTGRSAKDKFIVRDGHTEDVIWWGDVNIGIDAASFDKVMRKVAAYLSNAPELFVLDAWAGADATYRLPVRVVNAHAWHNLFIRHLLIPETGHTALQAFEPGFTILHAPEVTAVPSEDGTRSGTFILVDFSRRLALIGGTAYAGEIKKTVFTLMNKLLPERGVLSMHCSANFGATRDDVALFFGLSGTGKTTLSADADRTLIGDDEHGWSDNGVFNIEGGCYAKVISLSQDGEPEIWNAAHTFGTVLENVVFDAESRIVNYEDRSITENTRAGYSLDAIPTMDRQGTAGHPRNIVFLAADAFGVLPPIARLSRAQAMYHYLSGYTAKVAGTEIGVTEPTATFSACFGAAFLPLHPGQYAELFGELLERHKPGTWLINTGWIGGPYGVGKRISLAWTRRIVRAALSGELNSAPMTTDPIFGFEIPTVIEGVPSEVLQPRQSWADAASYDKKAKELAAMFRKNFQKYASGVSEEVRAVAPKG